MKDSDYAEATGYIRAVEKRLLNTAGLERVLAAPSAADALRLLSQTGAYDFGMCKRPADYEDVLKGELRRVYEMMYKLSPAPDAADILSLKYDFHNVKAVLKARYAGQDASGFLYDVTRTPPEAVTKAVASGDTGDLPGHLADAVAQGKAAFEATGAPGPIDLALDRLMFAEMRRRADRLGSALILEYVQKAIDLYNMKTLFRVRAMGDRAGRGLLRSALAGGGGIAPGDYVDWLPKSDDAVAAAFHFKFFGDAVKIGLEDHDRSGHWALLEKLSDDILLEHVKKAKYVVFGPEPLFAYLCAKENELRQIRVILTGKLNRLPGDEIQKRLRVCYV